MVERVKKQPKPKEMAEIVVGAGQVVLGPGKARYAGGESVQVPTTLLAKNPGVAGVEAVDEAAILSGDEGSKGGKKKAKK